MYQPALIEFENISVMRGNTIAVNDVSLKIGVGEHVAILGPNGCGKSTLIKAITRERYPLVREGSSLTYSRTRTLERFRVADTAGNCIERSHDHLHAFSFGARDRDLRFFLEHRDLAAPGSHIRNARTSRACDGNAGSLASRRKVY